MNDLTYVKYDTDHFTRTNQEGELYALNRDQLELITSILKIRTSHTIHLKLNFAQRSNGIKMRTPPWKSTRD